METITLALFGEAEKGTLHIPYFCRTLEELVHYLGNPPPETRGIYLAIQALLYERDIVFLRVREEGFFAEDYHRAVETLKDTSRLPRLDAVCAPGVGDQYIIGSLSSLCDTHEALIIMNESDLYDYLTAA